MSGNARVPGRSVISRATALLRGFSGENRVLTLSELARRSGLPLPTAHRLARELVEAGVLGRTSSGGYVVGRWIWSLGLLAPMQTDLREIAAPFLQDLHAATLATVHLAVREDSAALYLDRISGTRSVSVVSKAGGRLPLHTTGVGKVLLAFAPAEVVSAVCAELRPVTTYSIRSASVLTEQLRRIRTDGHATTVDEMTVGTCSVAVPIRAPDNSVAAALGVVVPTLERDGSRLLAALHVTARGIARGLATNPYTPDLYSTQ